MIRRLSDRFWNYLTDRIEARMHLRPSKDNAFDLGSSDYAWRRAYVGPGSASAPSISPAGDPNTGIYQSAADNLDFATGGVQRVNIDDVGAVTFYPATGFAPRISRPAGNLRLVGIYSSASLRWAFGAHSGAESGSNAGSDFYIYRYDDNGDYLNAGVRIYRTSGNAWFEADVSALSFTDRTPYPDRDTALAAVRSLRQAKGTVGRLDHSALHEYVRATDEKGEVGRNLSATVSAQNVVIQELLERIESLESQLSAKERQ